MDDEISVTLVARQFEAESVAFAALGEWVAEVRGGPVHGLISLGVGKSLLAQTASGRTSPAAARASQVVVGIVRRDDFGPDGPTGPREYVVDPVDEFSPAVAQIRMRTVEENTPGRVTLHVSLVPRAPTADLQRPLAWWQERAVRLQNDVRELKS